MLNRIKNRIEVIYVGISKTDTVIFKHYLFNLIIGALLSETFYLGKAIAAAITAWLTYKEINLLFIQGVCGLLVLFVIFYSLSRGVYPKFIKIAKSNHSELMVFVVAGILISSSLNGIGYERYEKAVSIINIPTLIMLAFLPIGFVFFSVLSQLRFIFKKRKFSNRPLFLNDDPISNTDDDLLDVSEKAERFSQIVLNNNSFDSLIFGLDSPWGAGKSSFIGLCLKHWNSSNTEAPLVHIFEPIKYLDQTNFTDKLASELIELLQKSVFDPKLSSSFEAYLDVLQDNNQFSVFGLNFKFTRRGNLNTEFEKLQKSLEKIDRKIIIVIDDLDRLSWQETKKILYSIKQSFKLKNVSYVLCYDSENLKLNAKNNDALEIVEFLEKYISIKFSLLIDRASLLKLVTSDSEKLLGKIYTFSPSYVDQVKSAVACLQDLYKSKNYYEYAFLLGDLRKVKRLINSILVCDLHNTDLENSDYDGGDLIKLLMLYISFPHIFRKIYDAETNGYSGIFSVVSDAVATKTEFVTSPVLKSTLNTYSRNEQVLLKSLFEKETLEKDNGVEIQNLNLSNRACFNGANGTARNLERYLHLIVNLRKQSKIESSTFFEKRKEEFKNGAPLERVFKTQEFVRNSEKLKLLNAIGNSANELEKSQADQLIRYLLENVPRFSVLDRDFFSSNSRNTIIYILLKVLDKASWRANNTFDNSNQNIKEITDWIFGEGLHQHESVIFELTKNERLPLGYYDLLVFRLYCSADRAGNLHNIYRSLSLRYNENAITSGSAIEIAKTGMRQISQAIFKRFEEQYIKPKRNFIADVKNLNLDLDDLDDIDKETDSIVNKFEAIEKTKSTVISFSIYQLTNQLIQSGVGCGWYDRDGSEDKGDIFKLMNDYLFDVCFNPKIKPLNLEYFIDYLLSNLATPFNTGEDLPKPVLAEFNKTLDSSRLKLFWKLNKQQIIDSKFHHRNQAVYTVNYISNYQRDLPAVFDLLNRIV